jgi:hypothetical protein
VNGRFAELVPEPSNGHLDHEPEVLAVHPEVDEEVAGAGEGEEEVAQVRDVRYPLRPEDIFRFVILEKNNKFTLDSLIIICHSLPLRAKVPLYGNELTVCFTNVD